MSIIYIRTWERFPYREKKCSEIHLTPGINSQSTAKDSSSLYCLKKAPKVTKKPSWHINFARQKSGKETAAVEDSRKRKLETQEPQQ